MRVYALLAVLPLLGCSSDFGLGRTVDDDDTRGDDEYGNADEHDWPDGGGWGELDPDALPDVYVALTIKADDGAYEVVYVDLRGQVAHRATIIEPGTGAEPVDMFAAGPGQVAVQTTGLLNMEMNDDDGLRRTPEPDQIFLDGYQLKLVRHDDTEAELLLASNASWTGVRSQRTGQTWPAGPFRTDYLASGMVPGDTEQLFLVASLQPCASDDAPPMLTVPIGYRALQMPSRPAERWLPDEVAPDHGFAVWSIEAGLIESSRSVAMLTYHGACEDRRLSNGEAVAGVWFPDSGRVWSRPVPFATRLVRHSPANGGAILVTTRTSEAAGWRLITEDWRVTGDQNPRVNLVPVGIIDAELGAFMLLEQTVDGSTLAVYFKGKRVYGIKSLRSGLEKNKFRALNAVFVPPL